MKKHNIFFVTFHHQENENKNNGKIKLSFEPAGIGQTIGKIV